jgi:PAS domain S-box-containing protein
VDMHPLLLRQLKRNHLSDHAVPADLLTWQSILQVISSFYYEADNERYILERSMDISSRELNEINNKLEESQHIAHLGYWSYDYRNNIIYWSKEVFAMLGYTKTTDALDFEQFKSLIHSDDIHYFNNLVEDCYTNNSHFEYEMRINCKHITGDHWFYIVGHPGKNSDSNKDMILTGIIMDINQRKQAESQFKELSDRFLLSARQAGMAEVAVSILHNVGNVLNSVNVSAGLVREILQKNYCQRVSQIVQMIIEHLNDLDRYMREDEKGKLIPAYLVSVTKMIESDNNMINNEVANLVDKIDHIKDIVSMQKDLANVSGLVEYISIIYLVDMALKMNEENILKQGINIVKDYQYAGKIMVNKPRLTEIMVNLINNARDAVIAHQAQPVKNIIIKIIKAQEKDSIDIIIEDNGVGIDHDNVTRIFTLGFTTKKNGHGFGLHTSAIAIAEMGGKLILENLGVGSGARFIIRLPVAFKGIGDNHNNETLSNTHLSN